MYKMAGLMLPLPTEATVEEKTNACTDQRHSTYHWKSQIIQENVDSHIKADHNQHRWWRGDRKIVNGKESLGHWHLLQSQRTLNLKLTRLLSRCDQSEVFWQHTCCIAGEARDFFWCNTSQYIAISEAIDSLQMWKKSRIYVLPGCPPLTLFAHHT